MPGPWKWGPGVWVRERTQPDNYSTRQKAAETAQGKANENGKFTEDPLGVKFCAVHIAYRTS